MQKILFGIMGILMTGSVVAASAFALFSDTAVVNGINFETGDANITVSPNGVNEFDTLDANLDISGVVPGFGTDDNESVFLWVHNNSEFNMDINAQLTLATGWNDSALRDWVEVAVVDAGEDPDDTDYKTLTEWNASPQPLDVEDNDLAAGQDRQYEVFVRLPSTAPDSLEDKSLTDIAFTITGTQIDDVVPDTDSTE